MTRITNSFLSLVLIIVFSSIIYIWKAEAEKDTLISQISSQQNQIEILQKKLNSIDSKDETKEDKVKGAFDTITGTISGNVTISNALLQEETVICALETFSDQEYCTDLIENNKKGLYTYKFDIPLGTYEVFILNSTTKEKIYYSEIQACDDSGNCISDPNQKRLIKVIKEEEQNDIDISI